MILAAIVRSVQSQCSISVRRILGSLTPCRADGFFRDGAPCENAQNTGLMAQMRRMLRGWQTSRS